MITREEQIQAYVNSLSRDEVNAVLSLALLLFKQADKYYLDENISKQVEYILKPFVDTIKLNKLMSIFKEFENNFEFIVENLYNVVLDDIKEKFYGDCLQIVKHKGKDYSTKISDIRDVMYKLQYPDLPD